MTRCGRTASINLKSSVYNPNGQSYFDQLATYNSMACHLRRILTAKSVVETRNERYTKSKQRQELKDEKIKSSQRSPSCEIIDRLAYDTEHHPADILRSSHSNSKMQCYRRNRKCPCCDNGAGTFKDCSRSTSKSRSPCKHEDCWYNKKYSRNSCEKRQSNRKSETKCQIMKRNQSPNYSSSFASDDSSPHLSGDESNDPKYLSSKKLMLHAEKEEARYAQFVYDITQDIVRKGLYTDKEFKEVFRKHLEKNAGVLDKHRMLYEIYQLKISLNIDEDDDEEYEQLADYIYSKRFAATSKPKPPTPPKVLDENKVVEKLKNYEQLMDKQPGISARKNVVLVDANPEILITERDILQTLIETNVNPNQAERICRTLFHKSKDTSLCQMAKSEREDDVTRQSPRTNDGKIKQSHTMKKKRNICALCDEARAACSCVTDKKLQEPKFKMYKYRDLSSTVNCEPQIPLGYKKLLNIVSECSQVTRSILEQRTKLQKMRLKEETHSRNEEKQQKINQTKITDKKMQRIPSSDDILAPEMKSVTATFTAISNVTTEFMDDSAEPEFLKNESLHSKTSDKMKETNLDMQKANSSEGKIKNDLLSVISEKDIEENVEDSYVDDYEDILTEKEESEVVTFSRENSKSDQKDDTNNSVHVDEDTSVQYSEFNDDQKDCTSASKDEISHNQIEKQSKDESEVRQLAYKIIENKRQCAPNCVKIVTNNCKLNCKAEKASRKMQQVYANYQDTRFYNKTMDSN